MQVTSLYITLIWCFCWCCSYLPTKAQIIPLPAPNQQLLNRGIELYNNEKYKEAYQLFEELITTVKKEANRQLLGQVYFNLAAFYEVHNHQSKSLDLLLLSSELLESQFATERSNIIVPDMDESPSTYLLNVPKDAALICEVYNKIGGVYFKQQNYKKAKKYWKKTYKIAKQYKSAKALASACNNLGELKRLNNKPKEALSYYNRALLIQKNVQDSMGMLVSWGNIGTIHLRSGYSDSAKYYYDKAYQLAQLLNDTTALLYICKDYGVYYQLQNATQKALKWTHKSLQLAGKKGDTDVIIEAHKNLAQLYEQAQNWDSLLAHQKIWSELQQKKTQQGRKKMIMQIEAEYVVNQQEKEVLRLRQAAALNKERNRQKDIIQWSISLGLLLLLLTTLWILYLTQKHNRATTTHIHEIEQQNAEKEILLKEIHHRVKNNLQVVTSLLHLQSYDIEDPKTKALFDQSQHRINSMAMIHEMLYQSRDLSAIDYQKYLKQLIHKLVSSIKGTENAVQLDIDIMPIHLNIDTAIPLGLLITELITNSLKYGLDKGKDSLLTVHLKTCNDFSYLLEIGDNGKGMKEEWTKSTKPQSLGLRLVKQLSLQLNGQLTQQREMSGTHYQLHFKEISSPV